MSVITVQKEFNEIQTMLFKRADLQVVVIGCDKCAKVSQSGGRPRLVGSERICEGQST
jgi:hypothetical protein